MFPRWRITPQAVLSMMKSYSHLFYRSLWLKKAGTVLVDLLWDDLHDSKTPLLWPCHSQTKAALLVCINAKSKDQSKDKGLTVFVLIKWFFDCCEPCITYNFCFNHAIDLKRGGRLHCYILVRIGQSLHILVVILAPGQ